MSIAEFLDGMPSFNAQNFSQFQSDNGKRKRNSVYISTKEPPSDQIIVLDRSNLLLQYLHDNHKKPGTNKRELLVDEDGSTSRKRQREI